MSLDLSRPAQPQAGPRRASPLVAWPLSIVTHAAVLAAVLVIPLMATDVLPTPQDVVAFMQAVPVPEPPVPPAPVRPVSALVQAIVSQRAAPVTAPTGVGEEPGVVVPVDAGLGDLKSASGVVPGIEGGLPDVLARAPVQPAAPEVPLRPGGVVRRPEKMVDVRPAYPELALRAKVQGMVIIEATIGKTGLVENATVLRGHPLLDKAALDAVRQWRYSPTLLNGVPISIIMTVTVQFTIEQPKH